MTFVIDTCSPNSPLIKSLWFTRSTEASSYIAPALPSWELIVTQQEEQTLLSIWRPTGQAIALICPPKAEFWGVRLQPGLFPASLPADKFAHLHLVLPVTRQHFEWLDGTRWQLPTPKNMDIFIEKLVQCGLLVSDPLVAATLQGKPVHVSGRTIRRRFLQAFGLPPGTVWQIERAQQATTLLQQGMAILDVVDQVGYADQSHLTRALKRFIGQTPAQLQL